MTNNAPGRLEQVGEGGFGIAAGVGIGIVNTMQLAPQVGRFAPFTTRVPLAYIIVLAGLGCLAKAQGEERHAPNIAFEEFIARPPVIEEMVYSVQKGTAGVSRHFQVRWQTNAFVYRELSSLKDAYKPTPSPFANFTSAFNDRVWKFDDANGITSYTTNEGSMVKLEWKLEGISCVLNGGVPYLPIGSIRWSNHSFTAVSHRTGFPISGVMHYDEMGFPEWMSVSIRSGRGERHRVIKYRYRTQLAVEGLPSRFEHYSLDRRESEPFQVLTIHSLRTRREPLPMMAYDLAPFAKANNSTIRWFENGELMHHDAFGRVQAIPKLGDR